MRGCTVGDRFLIPHKKHPPFATAPDSGAVFLCAVIGPSATKTPAMTTSAVSTRSHRTSLLLMLGSTACFITNSGRSAWFIGALLVFIYAIFAMTLYMVPPGSHAPI